MNLYVLDFSAIDKTMLTVVGGKGANLGELAKLEGVRVPPGFCVTTTAYKKTIGDDMNLDALMDRLSTIGVADRDAIGETSASIRQIIEGLAMASDIREDVVRHLADLGEDHAWAVRSSATAEDLPTASFAGQQDTYLNIRGKDAVLEHIRKCWASLFTDRAVIYRLQNGIDHRQVYLSVVVQQMVFPEASGVMFTADPITSNRKVVSINAGFGLGEALVSGLVNPDQYRVRDGRIVDRKVATKQSAINPLADGGTEIREVELGRRDIQVLADDQILRLERIGRNIEKHFGCPQDIEWCLAEDGLSIVQSRPITTLFPVPAVSDGKNHVFMSIGHPQMMTDPIKTMGISFFKFLSDVPLQDVGGEAGGWLFLDVSHDLASPIGRRILINQMGQADLLMQSALAALIRRKGFLKTLPRGKRYATGKRFLHLIWPAIRIYRKNDASLPQKVMARYEAVVRNLEQRISGVSGGDVFAFILEDQKTLIANLLDPQSMGMIMAAVASLGWLNKRMEKWLDEKSTGDTLSKSVPNNITSEMGLALMDVSDVVRKYPAVIEYFGHVSDENFFDDLGKVEGGPAVGEALRSFLTRYGARCPGEIDITRPRWSEKPTMLIPAILSNVNNLPPHVQYVKFEEGKRDATAMAQDFLARLERLPGGKQKAKSTRKRISVLRNFIGYREYPKYFIIRCYQVYKNALMKEAALLVEKCVILEKEDVYYLSFDEFRDAVRTNRLDYGSIAERKREYAAYEKMTPPRVITSEGEVISGEYNAGDIPPGALAGVPVSSGVVEGRARVVLKMEDAVIEENDILVTAFTDPSWTPLFVSVKGLVTEMGGLMTHGAVVAREYGLPAVVGVENATKLIKNGQLIRVNGTEGYVEKIL